MREINPDKMSQNVVLLHNEAQHHQLARINRFLVYSVMVLMTLVVVLGLLLWPTENPLEGLKRPATQLHNVNPGISSEINMLKGQVAGLVSGSIESKLRMLEESIQAGSVKNALGTIQDLKRDVRVLQSYSEPPVMKETPKVVVNELLLQEVSHLKNLVYLTLASVSLIAAALAGIWFRRRYQLPHHRKTYLAQEK